MSPRLPLQEWEKAVDAWQRPILDQPQLPSYYKSLLFNELYFLVDGGTLWLDSAGGDPNRKKVPGSASVEAAMNHPALKLDGQGHGGAGCTGGEQATVGQFLYLEGHEYLMYNTYDVHFYASFALTSLWPQLQLSLQRDFASAVSQDDRTVRRLLGNGGRAARKVAGCVPHDLGSPCEEPWAKTNVYNFQDVSRWKDLGPKFVLTVLRDYEATKSAAFVKAVFPTVVTVMKSTAKHDKDGDGLIENSGFPDQTYDIWSVKGPSAYTGGLWVGALAAGVKLAKVMLEVGACGTPEEGLGDSEHDVRAFIAVYEPMYGKAQAAYEEALWNGTYYNYDGSRSYQSSSIMSDQCAGQWYARACGLPSIVDPSRARSALQTVFAYNVMGFARGRRGAVNGMRHNTGKVDTSSMQSREVWTGTTYAVAAVRTAA